MADFERAIANLSSASIVRGGWMQALKTVAITMGGRSIASLKIADANAGFYEQFIYCADRDCNVPGVVNSIQPKPDRWHLSFAKNYKDLVIDSTNMDTVSQEWVSVALLGLGDAITNSSKRCCLALINVGDVQGLLTVHARDGEAPFSSAEMAAFLNLHAHIERAAIAYATFGAIRAALYVSTRLMDQLPFGVLMLDSDGRLIDSNKSGKRLIEEHSILVTRNDLLFCTDQDENRALQLALRTALLEYGLAKQYSNKTRDDKSTNVLKLYGSAGVKPWSISISSLRGAERMEALAWGRNRARVIVSVSDRQPITELRASQVSAIYGLSPQEENLTARLAAGDNLALIARTTDRSVETLRTQLRAVFQKTEVGSQSQLVQLVLCAPAGL